MKWSLKAMWGDAMKVKVNRKLLSTIRFDSGALGMMAMVLHQFSKPGFYRAIIKKPGERSTGVDILVDEKSTERQLDIDMAQAIRQAKMRPGADCCKSEKATLRTISPKGYVLFFASSGSDYSVTVVNSDDKVAFDSTHLSKGDLFAVSLLEPGGYIMANKLGRSEGKIKVSLTLEMAREIKKLEAIYVDVGKTKFDPQSINLSSSQGLVFRIDDSARILIEKKEKIKKTDKKPDILWKKL